MFRLFLRYILALGDVCSEIPAGICQSGVRFLRNYVSVSREKVSIFECDGPALSATVCETCGRFGYTKSMGIFAAARIISRAG